MSCSDSESVPSNCKGAASVKQKVALQATKIIEGTINNISKRFEPLFSHRVMKAAAAIINPANWPESPEGLAEYGVEYVKDLYSHF